MPGLGKKIQRKREKERREGREMRERENDNSQHKKKRNGGGQQRTCDPYLHKAHSHHQTCSNTVSSPPWHYSSKTGWSHGSDATSLL